MKKFALPLLLSLVLLSLPTFAQQAATSNSNDQSARETATGKPPLQNTKGDFWDGDQPSVAWLILHPFASKGYVKRHLQATQDRVNELDDLTASNARLIQDVDSRSQRGIQLASAKVTEADQHALDAGNKAQMANQTATATNTRISNVETIVGTADQYKPEAQTVIRFRPGQSVLSKQAKDALDEMAAGLKDKHGYVIEVQGFAGGAGQTSIASSKRMADSVVRYLVLNREIPAYRIYTLGMGNTPGTTQDGKRTTGSRVEVNVLKNDLDRLTTTTASTQ